MSDALDAFAKVFIGYAKKLRADGDALVPLTDHAKYTDLTYRQVRRMITLDTLAHVELPFSNQIWVKRSDLRNATPASVGRPTTRIE